MHTILLFFSVIISLALGAFGYLALSAQINMTLYILLSLGISIALVFLCEHYMIASRQHRKECKKLSYNAPSQAAEIQSLQNRIAELESALAKAQEQRIRQE